MHRAAPREASDSYFFKCTESLVGIGALCVENVPDLMIFDPNMYSCRFLDE